MSNHEQLRTTVAAPPAADSPTLAGTSRDAVGPYRLLKKLGEGGMGVVYLAEQTEPVRRRVALKIIKPGLDSAPIIARFEAERQALALMNHPNIARVLDAGTLRLEGPPVSESPYFVMELVEGVPITHFAEQNALNLSQRLELFADVCLAIQHAHAKGVLHRDIKPSNVLVVTIDSRPVAKVIDFGLAKALYEPLTPKGDQTQIGSVVGTPEYMSPEQASLSGVDVDTRSDVFSLGVMLYQLLTSTTPAARDDTSTTPMLDLLRRVASEEAERPSARLARTGRMGLARQVRGELDWVVMKALEKDRALRYQTALGLALDVRRYLAGEPVDAAPPSRWYRVRKLAARHRVALVTAGGVLVLLLAATVVSVHLAIVADRERKRAKLEGEIAAAALKFLQEDVLGQPGPDLQARPWVPVRRDLTIVEALDHAAERLHGRFADTPRIEIAIRNTIGNAYREMGATDRAEKQLDAALALARATLGEEHLETLKTLYNLSWVYGRQARYTELEILSAQLVATAERVLGPRDRLTLVSRRGLGYVLFLLGNYKPSETLLEPTLEGLRQVCGKDHEETLDCLDTLATCYRYRGKDAQADALLRQALELGTKLGTEGAMYRLTTRLELALLRACQGRFDEADTLSAAVVREHAPLGERHPETRVAMRERAWILQRAGRKDETRELLHQLIKHGQVPGESAGRWAAIGQLHGECLLEDGKHAEAEEVLRPVLRVYAKLYHEHWLVDWVRSCLGASLFGQGKADLARPLLRQGYEGLRRHEASLPAFERGLPAVAKKRMEKGEPSQ